MASMAAADVSGLPTGLNFQFFLSPPVTPAAGSANRYNIDNIASAAHGPTTQSLSVSFLGSSHISQMVEAGALFLPSAWQVFSRCGPNEENGVNI